MMTSEQQSKGDHEKAKQAQQLDQLTDHVQDREMVFDASKAAQIMSSLQSNDDGKSCNGSEVVNFSKEDVQKIVDELEVTDDAAINALKAVAQLDENQSQDVLVQALKYLVTS